MSTIEQKRLERLNAKIDKLTNEICASDFKAANVDEAVKKIKELEAEKKLIKKSEQLKKVNAEHEYRRNLLKEILALDIPEEDITKNDGRFHAIKVKKHPSLLKFMEKHPYARFKFEYMSGYISVECGGRRYVIKKPNYEGTSTHYVKFDSVEEALIYNHIMVDPMGMHTYAILEREIIEESNKIKEQIEAYSKRVKELRVHFLDNNGLINSNTSRSHTEYYSI